MKNVKINAYLELVKIKRTINYGLISFIGSFLAFDKKIPILTAFEASIAINLAAFGSYALNDLFDLDLDRINAPWRPMPSGRITKKEVKIVSAGFMILSLIIASMTNFQVLFFTLLFSIIGIAYSIPPIRLKKSFLANLCVAAGFLICIMSGSSIGLFLSPKVILAAIAIFTMTLGSSSIKDLKDITGDERMGIKTLPILIGPKKTLLIIAASSCFGIQLLFFEYLLFPFNWTYPILIMIMFIILMRSLILAWRDYKNPIICEKAWKGYSLAGLPLFLAFLLGSF
jgi:geranylgeranylglycerol-phosphate geranylgeranyltransferase